MDSRPPSPILGKGYFSVPFVRDEALEQWTSGFTLLGRILLTSSIKWHFTKLNLSSSDTFETYFDSHVDLLQRKLQKHSDRLKLKAEGTFKIKDLKIKDLSGDILAENFEREIKNFKLKVCRLHMCCQASHGFNATDTDIYAYDLIVRFLAVSQGCSYTREDFIFLRRHERAPFNSLVWTGSPVRSLF